MSDTFLDDVISAASNEELSGLVSDLELKTFSLAQIREKAQSDLNDPKLILQLAIIGAMRGNNPRDAADIRLHSGATLESILRNNDFYLGGAGSGDGRLSLVRLSQAFAEAVVLTLKKIHEEQKPMPKRFMMNRLPPYLEFMGAGSLILPSSVRREHRIYAHEFSKAIGGESQPRLYEAMARNAEPTRKLAIEIDNLMDVGRLTDDEDEVIRIIYAMAR